MKKLTLFIAVLLCVMFAINTHTAADEPQFTVVNDGLPNQPHLDQNGEQPYIEGQVVVKMREYNFSGFFGSLMGTAFQKQLNAAILSNRYKEQVKSVTPYRHGHYYIMETHQDGTEKDLCGTLEQDPNIIAVSLNYIAHITAVTPPNDPYFEYQYALQNTGQVYLPSVSYSGTAGSDLSALAGWEWSTGTSDVIIAVLDTGICWNHEDLMHKVITGYNFVDDNDNPYDDHGHGTFAASIAAADTNNGTGMAGVSWNSRLMPVKVMSSNGYGSYLAIGTGIRYAADHGAKVINLSIGGASSSFILEDACQHAYSMGSLVVASTGNQGGNVLYPAAYDDYCLAVGASDDDDNYASYSNHGPQVDVVAPGSWVFGAIFQPDNPEQFNNYGWSSGTSYSCPYAAGTAALLFSYKPFLTPSQVMDLIRYTADDVNKSEHPGVDDYMGYGRINLETLLAPFPVSN